jgi:hypothetical protein
MRYYQILRETSEQTQSLLNILEPLAASGKEEILIDDFVKMVNASHTTSLLMDREAVMTVLEPSDNGLVKSIDGEKIYFGKTIVPLRKVADKQREKEEEKISKQASSQAVHDLGAASYASRDRTTHHMLSQLKHI